jgi:hypothetical protein
MYSHHKALINAKSAINNKPPKSVILNKINFSTLTSKNKRRRSRKRIKIKQFTSIFPCTKRRLNSIMFLKPFRPFSKLKKVTPPHS